MSYCQNCADVERERNEHKDKARFWHLRVKTLEGAAAKFHMALCKASYWRNRYYRAARGAGVDVERIARDKPKEDIIQSMPMKMRPLFVPLADDEANYRRTHGQLMNENGQLRTDNDELKRRLEAHHKVMGFNSMEECPRCLELRVGVEE